MDGWMDEIQSPVHTSVAVITRAAAFSISYQYVLFILFSRHSLSGLMRFVAIIRSGSCIVTFFKNLITSAIPTTNY